MELFGQKFEQGTSELLAFERTVVVIIKSGWKVRWMSQIQDKNVHHFDLKRDNLA